MATSGPITYLVMEDQFLSVAARPKRCLRVWMPSPLIGWWGVLLTATITTRARLRVLWREFERMRKCCCPAFCGDDLHVSGDVRQAWRQGDVYQCVRPVALHAGGEAAERHVGGPGVTGGGVTKAGPEDLDCRCRRPFLRAHCSDLHRSRGCRLLRHVSGQHRGLKAYRGHNDALTCGFSV